MELIKNQIRNRTTQKSFDKFRDCIIDSAKNIKSNDETFQIATLATCKDKLFNLMEDYIDFSERADACESAFSQLHEQAEAYDEDEHDDYQNLEEFANLFKSTMEQAIKPLPCRKTAIESLQKIINVDEEIQLAAPAMRIPKDPVTKMDIRFAVKSTVCNHIYDKEGIETYFRQKEAAKRARIQCPQAGCTNKSMTREELVEDDETNKLIESVNEQSR